MNDVVIFKVKDEEYPSLIFDKDAPQSEIDAAFAEIGITFINTQSPWRWNK